MPIITPVRPSRNRRVKLKRKEGSMNLCLLGTIATGVETLRARVKYNMNVVLVSFVPIGHSPIREIMVSCGWVILPIWMAWLPEY